MNHHHLAAQGSTPDVERAACCLENVLPMVLGGQALKDLLCLEAALQGNQEAKQEGLSVVRGALVRCKQAGRYRWLQVQAAARQQDGSWQLAVGQVDQRRTIKSEFVSSVPKNKSEAGAQAELAELATRWHSMQSSRWQVARIQWMVEGGTDQLGKILEQEGIPAGTGSFPVHAPALKSLMATLRGTEGPASRFPLVLSAAAVPPANAAGAGPGVVAPMPAPLAAATTAAAAQQRQQQPQQQLHGASMHTVSVTAAACHSMQTLPQLHSAESIGTRPVTSSTPLSGPQGSAEAAIPRARAALPSHALHVAEAGPAGNSGGVHSSVAKPASAMTAALLRVVPAAESAVGPAEVAAAAVMAPTPKPPLADGLIAAAAVAPGAAAAADPGPSTATRGELFLERTSLPIPAPAPSAVAPSSVPGTNAVLLGSAALHAPAEADPLAFLAELKRDVAELMGTMGLDANGCPLQADGVAAALGGGCCDSLLGGPVPGAAETTTVAQNGRGAQEGSSVPAAVEAAVQAQAEGPLAGLLTVGVKRSHCDAGPAVGATLAKQARGADLAEAGQRAGGVGAGSNNAPQPAAAVQRKHSSGAAAKAGTSAGSEQSSGRTTDSGSTSSRSRSRQRSDSSSCSRSRSPSSRRSSGSHRRSSRSSSRSWRHRRGSRGRSRSGARGYHSRSRSGSRSGGRRYHSRSRSRSGGRGYHSRSRSRSGARGYHSRSRSGGRRYRSRSSSRHVRSRSRSRELPAHLGALPSRVQQAICDLCDSSRGVLPVEAFDRRVVDRMETEFGLREHSMLDFLDWLYNAMPRYVLGKPAAWVMHHLTCYKFGDAGLGRLPGRVQDAIEDLCEKEGRDLPLSSFDGTIIKRMQEKLGTEQEMLRFLDHVEANLRPHLQNPASWMMSLLNKYRIF